MKRIILLVVLLTQFSLTQAQFTLQTCYRLARENYPNLKQTEIWEEINALNKENLKSAYLPQVNLNAQSTYQSDVPYLNPGVPGFSIPKVSKDQYKAYAEIRQTIWDGGISSMNSKLEDALLKNNLSALEVEVYKLNEQVAQAFFTSYVLGKQMEVLKEQKVVLDEKLRFLNSGIENGIAESSFALVIKAEILGLEQQEIQLKSGKIAALQMLSILTGEEISEESGLMYSSETVISAAHNRPEFALFESQKQQLKTQIELLDKTRNPKLFGFGQAGFGKPGLNVLNVDPDTYYLVGIGISWKAFDWKNTQRKKQVLQQTQFIIDRKEDTFKQNLALLLAKQKEQINKIEELLISDTQLISLRKEISKSAASKLENDVITASDYVRELQAETVSKLNFEIHKIQLNEAKEKFNLIQGQPVTISDNQ